MATQVGSVNGATQQVPYVDMAVVGLAQQLKKLRADIVAGKHARFKVPGHLMRSSQSTEGGSSAATVAHPLPNGVVPKATALNPVSVNPTNNASSMQHPPQADPLHAHASTLSPAATLQRKRQDLERTLEEQIQQKKALSRRKTCDQEIVADFDVSNVLKKAHELVKPWRPTDSSTTNRAESSSDSFDENTFYSSQMNESTTTEEAETTKNWKRPLRACRFFRDGKPCPYGEKCTFSHDPAVVKKIEAEEQQRAVANQARSNEQVNRGAANKNSRARPPVPSAPAKDSSDSARIAELEEQVRKLTQQQQQQMKQQQSKPKAPIVPRAIERPDPEPMTQTDEFGRDRSKRGQYTEEPKDSVRFSFLFYSLSLISE